MNESIQTRIREYHEYVRHIFGLFITWFTFFISVNYVGIGWFASKGDEPDKGPSVKLVGTMFCGQCLLAIAVCVMLLFYFYRAYEHIVSLQQVDESMDKHLKGKTSMPRRVYMLSVFGGMLAIGTVLVTWLYLAFFWDAPVYHALNSSPRFGSEPLGEWECQYDSGPPVLEFLGVENPQP